MSVNQQSKKTGVLLQSYLIAYLSNIQQQQPNQMNPIDWNIIKLTEIALTCIIIFDYYNM